MVNDAQWLTVNDVADVLQVKVETVRRWIRRGQLSALELGGPRTVYRIRPDDLDRFIWQRYHTNPEDQQPAPNGNGSGHRDATAGRTPAQQPPGNVAAEEPPDGTYQRSRAREPIVSPEQDIDYRRLVEELPSISYIYREEPGEDGRITYISPQIEQLLGIPMSEWQRNPQLWLDLMHPDDRVRYQTLDTEDVERFSFEFRWMAPDGRELWLTTESMLVRDDDGSPLYWHGLMFDVTEQRQVAEQLQARVRQHETLARLGRRALEEEDPEVLFNEVVRFTTEALNVEHSRLFSLLPGGNELVLRATVGWKDGRIGLAEIEAGEVGETLVSAQEDTQSGFTLMSDEPVISNDLRVETRFNGKRMFDNVGVVSGVTVLIPGRGRPFGILGAHSTRLRKFTYDDVFFLQAVAGVLAGVVKRSDERWLTVQGVADILQVTEETVRRWIRRGDLPAMNLGGPRAGYRMHPADLHKFIRERISTSP